jgi:AsmA family/AsmA-like C-terminal region
LGDTLSAVKKVSKAILILFASVLVLAAVALLAINLYIQSPGAQGHIQEALSNALRVPLKITNTSLTPSGGLSIHGVSVPAEGANFLEADSLHASCRFFPLLSGRLEIAELSVESPRIHWVQGADGKWKLPALEKTAAKEKPKTAEKSRRGFEVSIDHFLVKDGSVELVDHDNKIVGTFSDVFLDYSLLTLERVEGQAAVGRAAWADAPALENVRTPFIYVPGPTGIFALPELTGTLAGGKVTGHFQAWPEAPKAPFETGLHFEDVNLDQLAILEGWQKGQAAGKLGGEIELSGETARAGRAEGPGKIWLRNGQLRQLELLQTIGQVLGIRELSDFHLQEAHADFHVSGEKIHVDDLTLAAADLQLGAKGTIRFDQRVSLEAQLAVEDAIVKRLPSLVSEGFATADSGRRTIDFSIGGTTSKLKTNLMDKLIVHKIDAQFGGLLNSLFGKRDDDKKKKDDEKRKKDKEAQKKAAAPPAEIPAAAAPAAAPASTVSPTSPTSPTAPAAPAPGALPPLPADGIPPKP